mmetsp:Transcript_2696/g.5704  ORF Transcript_2696/g.5704 Transcript_2696/m.5704 type:complete len:234 (-) Transcript_2696:213-914(-)
MLPSSSKSLGHSFYRVFVSTYVHTRDTGYFSNPPTQFLITRRYDETFPLLCHVRQTVVRIPFLGAITGNSFEAWILGQAQRDLVFATQFFELRHDTVRNAGYAFGQQTIHHGSDHVEFFTNTKVDKICINQNIVRRTKLLVVLEKQGRVGLFDLTRLFFFLFFSQFLRLCLVHILSYTCVVWRHHPFCNGKLSCLFGFPHSVFWSYSEELINYSTVFKLSVVFFAKKTRMLEF